MSILFCCRFFWGELVRRKHLGPAPCSIKQLTLARAIESISYLLLPKTIEACKEMSLSMQKENGVDSAISSFYRHLPYQHMLCEVSLFMNTSMLAEVECSNCGGLRMCRDIFQVVHSSSSLLSTHIAHECSHVGSSNIHTSKQNNLETEKSSPDRKVQVPSTAAGIVSTIQRLTTKIGDRIKTSLFTTSISVETDTTISESTLVREFDGEDGIFYHSDDETSDSDSTAEIDFDYDGDIANYLEISLTQKEITTSDIDVEDRPQSTLNTKIIDKKANVHFNLMENHGVKSSTNQQRINHSEYLKKRNEIIQAYQEALQARQVYLSLVNNSSAVDCHHKILLLNDFMDLFEQYYNIHTSVKEDFAIDRKALINSFKVSKYACIQIMLLVILKFGFQSFSTFFTEIVIRHFKLVPTQAAKTHAIFYHLSYFINTLQDNNSLHTD